MESIPKSHQSEQVPVGEQAHITPSGGVEEIHLLSERVRGSRLLRILTASVLTLSPFYDVNNVTHAKSAVESEFQGEIMAHVSEGNLLITIPTINLNLITTSFSLEELLRDSGTPADKRKEILTLLEGRIASMKITLSKSDKKDSVRLVGKFPVDEKTSELLGLASPYLTVAKHILIPTESTRPRRKGDVKTDLRKATKEQPESLQLVRRSLPDTFYANKKAKRTKGYTQGGFEVNPIGPLEINAFGKSNSYIQLVFFPFIDTTLDPEKADDRKKHGPMNFRIYVDDNREPLRLPEESTIRHLQPGGSFLSPLRQNTLHRVYSKALHLKKIFLGPGRHRIIVESDDTHWYRVMVLGMRATEAHPGDVEEDSGMPAEIPTFPCEVIYDNTNYNFKDGTGGKATAGYMLHIDKKATDTQQDAGMHVYLVKDDANFEPNNEGARTLSRISAEQSRVVYRTVQSITSHTINNPSNTQACAFKRDEPPSRSENRNPHRMSIKVEVDSNGNAITETNVHYTKRFYKMADGSTMLYVWGKTPQNEIEAFRALIPADEDVNENEYRLERY